MLNTNNQLTIKRKGFTFPLSIKSFTIDETAKVATYEYAGMNGALHERVLNYRTINVSGLFDSYSGTKSPEYYIKQLQKLNDNKPWILFHPTFGTFIAILHSLRVWQSGDEVEADDENNVIPVYTFDMEFWEFSYSGRSKDLDKLYPAISVRPSNDKYTTELKYHNCDELYQALVDGLISAGTDPILNAEWLLYDFAMRSCAYQRWLANPNGETSTTEITNDNQKNYIVKAWDYWLMIARKFNVPFDALRNANQGRKVRETDWTVAWIFQWMYRKTPHWLRPWDILVIPAKDNQW